MKYEVSLIIILHNRHINLERLLEFYDDFDFPIIIADSSIEKHLFRKQLKSTIIYKYIPGFSYTQKIEKILYEISTPYIALCADDDFIIHKGLLECVSFLNDNRDFSSAQGLILRYYKNTIKNKIRFDMLYQGDYSLNDVNPAKRLEKLFNPYKSLLYAVHRTEILKLAFDNAGATFKNLYLNEYLTSIIPVLKGKHKDLTCLYQVREYSEISDDKKVDNLDVILNSENYRIEFLNFLDHLLDKSDNFEGLCRESLKKIIIKSLINYAKELESFKRIKGSFKKQVGEFISYIPFVGMTYVQNRRYKKSVESLKKHVNISELNYLKLIGVLLKKYEV